MSNYFIRKQYGIDLRSHRLSQYHNLKAFKPSLTTTRSRRRAAAASSSQEEKFSHSAITLPTGSENS